MSEQIQMAASPLEYPLDSEYILKKRKSKDS